MKHFIPEGLHTITPYLIVEGGVKAIRYYQEAFGAELLEKHLTAEGKLLHARLKIGDSQFMLSDGECPSDSCHGLVSPHKTTGCSSLLHLYVEDVDHSFEVAVGKGAKALIPVQDMFWGDRYGQLEDPFGHRWSLATPQKQPSI